MTRVHRNAMLRSRGRRKIARRSPRRSHGLSSNDSGSTRQRTMVRRTDQPDNEDLARWLSRVSLGDRRAFEQLYRETSTYLMAIAWRVLQHRDLAEEVLQESFVKVWHSAGLYDARLGLPMTWLINIVRNRAIDLRRSRSNSLVNPHGDGGDDSALDSL